MKTNALIAALMLVPAITMMQTSSVAAVAVIDFDRAVADTPEGKEAITKLNAFGTERRTAIQAKVKEATDLENRLRVQGTLLNDATKAQIAKDLAAAEASIQTMQEEAQNKLDEMRLQLLGPVEKKTLAAVNAYASERGLKVVLDASTLRDGLVYVHDTADITTEIIRRIAADMRKSGPQNAFVLPQQDPAERLQRQFLRGDWFAEASREIAARQ
jgi:Skp family chaperone for outer membrane proteins